MVEDFCSIYLQPSVLFLLLKPTLGLDFSIAFDLAYSDAHLNRRHGLALPLDIVFERGKILAAFCV